MLVERLYVCRRVCICTLIQNFGGKPQGRLVIAPFLCAVDSLLRGFFMIVLQAHVLQGWLRVHD
jgi:hypothetical protein